MSQPLTALKTLASIILPSSAPLEGQQTQLAQAREVHTAARAESERALVAFDHEGTEASRRALARAKEAEQEALAYVQRGERNLAKAERENAETEKKARERRAAELRKLIADHREHERLEAAEVRAWLALVDARVARREQNVKCYRLEHELNAIEIALGRDPARDATRYYVDPSGVGVAEALERAREGERDEWRNRLLFAAARAARELR